MQKHVIALSLVLGLAVGSVQTHAFGLGKLSLTNPLSGGSSSGGDVGAQVEQFQTSTAVANQLLANSSVYLLRAVVSKERGAELQKQLDTINQISDPKEKNAELAKLVESSSAELATAEKNAETKASLKKASSAKKKAIGLGLFNLSLGLLQVDGLTKTGNGIVSGVAKSPTEGLKVVPVKDTLPVLSALASNGKSILDSGLRLAKSADIKAEMPASSDAKPQELAANAFD